MAFRTRALTALMSRSLRLGSSETKTAAHLHLWAPRVRNIGAAPVFNAGLLRARHNTQQKNFSSSASAAGETNLVSFLNEEIEAEKQHARQNLQDGVAGLFESAGFQMAKDSAEVKLTKTYGTEKITVTFNVNNTVDAVDQGVDTDTPGEEQTSAPMIARPPFLIEIQKGDQKLAFDCQIAEQPDVNEAGEPGDLFSIEELYVYEGELNDKVYASSASVIDGTLYDHLMGYLEERGMDNKFADGLVQTATHHEHAEYVNLLHKIKDFVAK